MRHLLRTGLDRLAMATGLLRWHEHRMRQGLTILMYHRVLSLSQCRAYPLASLPIPVEVFRRQMLWLASHCRVLPLRKAVVEFTGGGPSARPLVAVTFDDGYWDNFELAAPVMEEFGLRGTFFVTTDFVTTGEPQWYDRAAMAWQELNGKGREGLLGMLTSRVRLKKGEPEIRAWMQGLKQEAPSARLELVARSEAMLAARPDYSLYRPMGTSQVRALHERGHEIGSHTVSHPILTQLNDEELSRELRHSAEKLGEWTGDKTTGFCYPDGAFNQREEQAVREAGYEYAVSVDSGLNLPGARLTSLARLPVTMQRMTRRDGSHDALGFRAELCRVRELWR